ncbi:hypothetical protein EBME_1481 [bacterium endosymbiont of Mortierella elongata FMR23-6]|nr:hypothetical protein EBME_1481 [bacterium endosymbiont of Mortierella elongata FMR23-6]
MQALYFFIVKPPNQLSEVMTNSAQGSYFKQTMHLRIFRKCRAY